MYRCRCTNVLMAVNEFFYAFCVMLFFALPYSNLREVGSFASTTPLTLACLVTRPVGRHVHHCWPLALLVGFCHQRNLPQPPSIPHKAHTNPLPSPYQVPTKSLPQPLPSPWLAPTTTQPVPNMIYLNCCPCVECTPFCYMPPQVPTGNKSSAQKLLQGGALVNRHLCTLIHGANLWPILAKIGKATKG